MRVVSVMEAASVTGPAKNMIQFASLAREQVDFSFITYSRNQDHERNGFVAAARAAGLQVDLIHEKGRFDTGVLSQLRATIAARNPHIIQTHNAKSHFLLRWSGLWRQHPWLAFHHGYTWVDWKMRLYHQLDRWSLQSPAHLVAVCGVFSQQLQKIGVPASRITVMHNTVSALTAPAREVTEALRQRLGCSDGVPILLIVGRLSSEKGHRDLLRALSLLRDRLRVRLLVVGEGVERARIEGDAERLGLRDVVTLVGQQDDLTPFYAIADLLVMPSHTEGSPNVLLEAMAQQVPVVATTAGGIPEIAVSGENALLVPVADAGKLADAIERMISEPSEARRLAANARALVEAEYLPERYCRQMIALYGTLAPGREVQ